MATVERKRTTRKKAMLRHRSGIGCELGSAPFAGDAGADVIAAASQQA
jgi:hypothetical protein